MKPWTLWRPFGIKAVLVGGGIALIVTGYWPLGVFCLLASLLEYA